MKKALSILMTLVLFMFALSGCGNATTNTKEDKSSGSSFQSQILFCGSSSLSPIIASLASSFTDEYVTWDKVNPSFPAEDIAIYVASGGSGVGVNAAINGTADFGMVARTVKDSEKEKMSADYKEYVVAADALTVSVNKNNPICEKISDMSTDTIRSIFSGEITKWSQVDSSLPDEDITVYIRDLSGGAYEVFQKSVMGDTEISPNAVQCPSMGALGTSIAGNQWGIGYASFGVYNQNIDSLYAFSVDGVEPTEENILSGTYSIQRPLLFITNSSISESEQAFIDYIFSQTGIDAVEANGYISQIKTK